MRWRKNRSTFTPMSGPHFAMRDGWLRNVRLQVLTGKVGVGMDGGMTSHLITKREFLKLTMTGVAAASAGGAAPLLAAAGADEKKRIPVGLQLYSVRNECAKDLPGTIAAVGKMGYKGVEFADYYERDAKTLRSLLDGAGLKCCGTHIPLDTLLGEKLAKTIEFNQVLGNHFLIVPSLPEKRRNSRQAWQESADLFSELADKVKPHGMRVGYHNHSIEFTPMDGEVPWDTFFNRTKKEVVIQFDTGNGVAQGGDPMLYLKKHPGRVARDRKSTRLNSSHANISYAVFCLKKKKK